MIKITKLYRDILIMLIINLKKMTWSCDSHSVRLSVSKTNHLDFHFIHYDYNYIVIYFYSLA